MALGYVVSCWLLVQVADLVLENIGSPPWVIQTIMLVLALGFPIVLFFSWATKFGTSAAHRISAAKRVPTAWSPSLRIQSKQTEACPSLAVHHLADVWPQFSEKI
jgi:hypothetical protein